MMRIGSNFVMALNFIVMARLDRATRRGTTLVSWPEQTTTGDIRP